ncbi:MAG: hypothetical protein H8M99_15985, partial [Gloeobacteraceae cyanobacterium ES-bin-144]|nr:hypothetical protein [Verrucomicrobiales bacterium]
DLEVDESIRFVTCNYCNARLEIVHDATVTHTKQLDKIEQTTHQIAGNLKVIELQNDLERLDREWEMRRNSLLVRGKDGQVTEPSAIGSAFAGSIGIGFGIFWIFLTGSNQGMQAFSLVGLLFIAASIYGIFIGYSKAGAYRKMMSDYELQRYRLIALIEHERKF